MSLRLISGLLYEPFLTLSNDPGRFFSSWFAGARSPAAGGGGIIDRSGVSKYTQENLQDSFKELFEGFHGEH